MNDFEPNDNEAIGRILVPFKVLGKNYPQGDTERFIIGSEIQLIHLWRIFRNAHTISDEDVASFLWIGLEIGSKLFVYKHIDKTFLSIGYRDVIEMLIESISRQIGQDVSRASTLDSSTLQNMIYRMIGFIRNIQNVNKGANTEEQLIAFTYTLIQRKVINHTEAAAFASLVLEENIKADTWRKRIVRWAKVNKELPVTAQRGRPKKLDD